MKMLVKCVVPVGGKDGEKFEIEIPDTVIEDYATKILGLMNEEMAVEYVADNPPDNDYEPD